MLNVYCCSDNGKLGEILAHKPDESKHGARCEISWSYLIYVSFSCVYYIHECYSLHDPNNSLITQNDIIKKSIPKYIPNKLKTN